MNEVMVNALKKAGLDEEIDEIKKKEKEEHEERLRKLKMTLVTRGVGNRLSEMIILKMTKKKLINDDKFKISIVDYDTIMMHLKDYLIRRDIKRIQDPNRPSDEHWYHYRYLKVFDNIELVDMNHSIVYFYRKGEVSIKTNIDMFGYTFNKKMEEKMNPKFIYQELLICQKCEGVM